MRWPSDNLLEQFRALRLCTRADVEACEPIVKRLCHDLPDFDSVWLDALVQRRTLTPWQADQLQSNNPAAIAVDDITIRESVGARTLVGDGEARSVVVCRIGGSDNSVSGQDRDRIKRLLTDIDEVRHTAPASICLPDRVIELNGADYRLVSEFVDGWTAEELLIRGGRLPWQAVAEIGRQMLEAIGWLESCGWTHGEIVLRNLRISCDGSATLVAPFVQKQQQPTVSITSAQRLKDVETTAPELVGTGKTADARSELYAVGCVLWQLLTARPPFASNDPVGRLQQGQLREISNVRELVPECPEGLATQLFTLTRRSPALRPASVTDAATNWNARTSGTSATRRLLKRLPDRSRPRQSVHAQSRTQAGRFSKVAAVALMVPLFSLYAWHRGLLPATLELKRTESVPLTSAAQSVSQPSDQLPNVVDEVEPAILSLPKPDAAGVVLLKSGKQYQASDLQFAGVMHIETDGQAPAIVTVSADWKLQASHVDISNLSVRVANDVAVNGEHPFLIRIYADVLSLRRCIIDNQAGDDSGAGLFWNSLGTNLGVVKIQNSVFRGRGYGLWLDGTPSRLEFDNVLLSQNAGGIRVDASQSPLRLSLSQVTQVGGNSFVDLIPEETFTGPFAVQIRCGESVLAPSAGLVRVATTESMQSRDVHAEFLLPERGNATIIPPEVDPILMFDRSLKQFVKLNDSQVISESLLIARPVFRGVENSTSSDTFQSFELLDYEGPKLSPRMPGISLPELPRLLNEVQI